MKIIDNSISRERTYFDDLNIGSVFKLINNDDIVYLKVSGTDAYPFNNGNSEAEYFSEDDIEVTELEVELHIKGIK